MSTPSSYTSDSRIWTNILVTSLFSPYAKYYKSGSCSQPDPHQRVDHWCNLIRNSVPGIVDATQFSISLRLFRQRKWLLRNCCTGLSTHDQDLIRFWCSSNHCPGTRAARGDKWDNLTLACEKVGAGSVTPIGSYDKLRLYTQRCGKVGKRGSRRKEAY